MEGYNRAGEGLFTRACSGRTRENGFKLDEGRCRDFREVVDVPSLEVFKARVGEALSNLV